MTGAPPRVLFAPAAAPEIGGGHVMRDLALAEALQAKGAEATFAVPPWGARLVARFAEADMSVVPLARSGEPAEIERAIALSRPHLLVLDDFSLAAPAVARFAPPGLRVAVVDDLADRTYGCDLLVDPGYGRTPDAYDGRVAAGTTLLTGPRYALLRRAFRRAAAEPPLAPPAQVERIFVSFGLSDVDAITARAVGRLRRLAPRASLDVALASDAASLPQLKAMAARDPRLSLHPDARDVAGLMRAADLGVGAGGSATWERCALGLPTLALVVADNQRAMIERLAQRGAVLACDTARPGFEAAFDDAVRRLFDVGERTELQTAGRAICDGQGAERVADALLALLSPR